MRYLAKPLLFFASVCAASVLHAQSFDQIKLVPNDANSIAAFAYSLDIDGDVAVISAIGQRKVYVWERSAGVWQQIQLLLPEESITGLSYGYDVAISGQRIVVGAPWTGQAPVRPSAVYVFEKNAVGWSRSAKLATAIPEDDDAFGSSVDISGDRIVVGSPSVDVNAPNVGVAHIYFKSAGGWTQEARVNASDIGAYDNFGNSVAIDGARVVVGSPGADNGSLTLNFNAGAAYVYEHINGIWLQAGKLTAPTIVGGESLGSAVAIKGDLIAVGAPSARVDNVSNRGAVDLFERGGASWSHQSRLHYTGSPDNVGYGRNGLAVGNNAVWIGAPQLRVNNTQENSVLAYRRVANSWIARRYVPFDGAQNAFGTALAISGDDALIGASSDLLGGAAYVLAPSDSIFRDGFETIAR